MDGLPLLPPDWRFGLIRTGLVMEIETAGRTEPKPILSESLNGSWTKPGAIWKAIPAEAARNVAEQFLADPKNHRWLDHPILTAPPRDFESILEIPYLQSTRHLLSEHGLLNHDLGWVLTSSSALEVWQTIGDTTALLDLIITSRNWVHEGSAETAVVATQENIFGLTAERFLAMAGVPIFSEQRNLANPLFRDALAGRCGFTPNGKVTLEDSGKLLGITRERLRQIASRYDLKHGFHRAWPANNVFESLIDDAEDEKMGQKVILRISSEFKIDESTSNSLNRLSLLSTKPQLPREISLACWNLSEGSGFFRIPDAIELLKNQHEFTDDQLRSLIEDAAAIADLPHDSAFVQYSRDPWVVETSHAILGELGQASITKLHLGLSRRHAGRRDKTRGAGPPARDVLLAFFAKHPDFEVHGDQITSLNPKQIDDSTVQAWILRQIKQAGGVVHSAVLFELARRDGINRSSLNVYLNVFGYLIEPIGYGCFTRLGDPWSPTDISIARSSARTISVPTTGSKWTLIPDGIKFECVAGTTLINTGVIGVPKRGRQLIGDQRFVVQSSLGTHGHIALSQSNLYGLGTAVQALGAAPGDTLHLLFNIPNQEATITISDE